MAATAAAIAAATTDIKARINTQSEAHAQAMLPSIIESVKQWIKNGELGNLVIQPSPKDSSPSVSFVGNLSPMTALNALTEDTPCSLLAYVNGELIKVAIGSIICPKDTIMHGVQMPQGVFKVKLSVVLPGYEDIPLPIQPLGVDSQLTLGQCLCWPMQWPKTQIRLGNIQIPTSSQQMNNGNMCLRGPSPLGQSQPEGGSNNNVHVGEDQQQVTANDELLVNRYFLVDEYEKSATMCNLDGPMPADPVEAFSVPIDHVKAFSMPPAHVEAFSMPPPEQEHVVPCQKSLFNNDFMPPDTQVPPPRGALLSPNTLNVTVATALPGASQPNLELKKRRQPGNRRPLLASRQFRKLNKFVMLHGGLTIPRVNPSFRRSYAIFCRQN